MELRPYQTEALSRLRQSIRAGKRRILLVAPTGSGKTVIAAHLLNKVGQKMNSGLFVAHRREIIHQTSDKLDLFGCHHGVLLAGHPRNMARIQVASIQTYVSRICNSDHPEPPANVVVYDEAHRSVARSYQKVLDLYPDTLLIGLTATPVRGDGRGLGNVYDELIEVTSVQSLIDDGYLVTPRVYAPSVPDLTGVHTKRGDYDKQELEHAMDRGDMVGNIVKDWQQRAVGRPTVVFSAGVQHSLHIRDEFRSAGVRAEHIDGGTPKDERDAILRELEAGDIDLVTNCDVLTEGWDCPPVSCAILARPTKSYGLYLQMAGRVLRPSEGKTDCLIIDHAGAIYRHGFVQDAGGWSLSTDTKIETLREKVKEERQPTTCRECFTVYEGAPYCPNCGWTPTRKAKALNMAEGRLREIKHVRKKNPLQDTWNNCLWVCIRTGRKVGAAAHMYRKKTGSWPSGLKTVPEGKTEWNMKARDYYDYWVKNQRDKGTDSGAAR